MDNLPSATESATTIIGLRDGIVNRKVASDQRRRAADLDDVNETIYMVLIVPV